jgi:hypothetical protein
MQTPSGHGSGVADDLATPPHREILSRAGSSAWNHPMLERLA